MPSKNKAIGNRLERQIVKWFQDAGFPCKRAYASNGNALGEVEAVDNVAIIHGRRFRIQAKRRKKIADYLKPPEGADAAIVKEPNKDALIVFRLKDFLEFLSNEP